MSEIKETIVNKIITILQKDNVTIIINNYRIGKWKQIAADAIAGNIGTDDIDCDAATYADEITRLVGIAERITKHDALDVFDYLPLTKAGTLNRTKNILLADSKVTTTYNGDYFSRKGLQLRLEWYYIDHNVQQAIGKNTEAITLRIDWFDASKKMEPVFDRNDQPHLVTQTRASYLKDSDLIPGHVYAEKSGTEYLYLGRLPIKEETFFFKGTKPPQGIIPTQNGFVHDLSRDYLHLKWTKKLQAMLASAKDITDFACIMAATDKQEGPWYHKASVRTNPRKFVSEICTVFDGTQVRPHIERTKDFPDYRPGDYMTRQYYIG